MFEENIKKPMEILAEYKKYEVKKKSDKFYIPYVPRTSPKT